MRHALALLLAFVIALGMGVEARAQSTGGSFGGNRGFGSSGGGGSSSGSSWGGGGGGSSWDDSARRQRDEERRRREAEERRRREEEARRRAEEAERQRREAEARELARRRAMPEAERARLPDFAPIPAPPAPNVGLPESPRGELAPFGQGLEDRWPEAQPLEHSLSAARGTIIAPFDTGAFGGSSCCCLFTFGLGFVGFAGLRRARRRAKTRALTPRGRCEVRRISLAFDWSARAAIQAELQALSSRYDMSSVEGMAAAARAARDLLARYTSAARYATVHSVRCSPAEAESRFGGLTADLRARYRHELVGRVNVTEAPALQARADEGQGLVVVTLLLGVDLNLPSLPSTLEPANLVQVLHQSLPAASEKLVALEVIWSPAAELDRMSSHELEAFYPELLRLDRDPNLGRVLCDYCRAVYPAELGGCPACGAPRDAS